MARLAASSHEVLGLDTIMPVFHSRPEAAVLGADTWWADLARLEPRPVYSAEITRP